MNNLDSQAASYTGGNLYDFDNETIMNWYSQRIIELNPDAVSVLELGLGHGFTTNLFSQRFARHLVLDGSSLVISNFRKAFPECKAELVETYFEKFETKEKFDLIVLGFVLEHVDDPQAILKRFRDFLAPEGKMYIAVPNAEGLNRRIGHHAGLLPDMQALSENDRKLGHKRYYTVKMLTEDIVNSGYDVTRMEGVFLKPFTTTQILSLNFDKKIIDALCTVGMDYPELSSGILAEIKNRKA